MKNYFLVPIFFFSISLISCNIPLPKTNNLVRSIPEAEGVSSEDILNFIEAAEKSKHELHSILILRHGKVIAEGWWNPYEPELKHTMYSTSKSFTSTAIGFAISEGRLALNNKVITFFPKDLPETISPNLAALTIKDLLTMSVGQHPDPTREIVSHDTNWVKSFLATPIVYKPGTKFLYNTMATYMLSAIVQKVTGEKIIDYLKPRLLEPLKIEGIDWEADPRGINTGGWGLRLKTEDMAKFGQLYLQKGKWENRQILPAEWVEDATSFKIDQDPSASPAVKDTDDWKQGYCYQFWRCRYNAFRADGAYGQYIIVLPEHDAVVVITGESPDMQDELNLVWEYLVPAFKKKALHRNSVMEGKLADKLSALALPLFPKTKTSPLANSLSGKTFVMARNERMTDTVRFSFRNNILTLNIILAKQNYKLVFCSDTWKLGETNRPGPYLGLFDNAKAKYAGLPLLKVAGNYQWNDSATLKLKLRYIESPHSENITCQFKKDSIYLEFANSNEFGKRSTTIKGKALK
jgi:CubicO group peptidase (beta-lactamase class C family)